MDSVDDVLECILCGEVVETKARKSELGAEVTALALGLHPCRPVRLDAVDAMQVRAGAEAAAACLDPEQVAEERDDEVVVQQPSAMSKSQGDDREPFARGVAEDLDVRVLAPRSERAPREGLLAAADFLGADLAL